MTFPVLFRTLALALLLTPLAGHALARDRALTQYVHRVFAHDQGLPELAVYSIAQTPDSYVWFATDEGLVRFDGVRMVVYTTQNTPFERNIISRLLADHDGTLWVGTLNGGLYRLRAGLWEKVQGPFAGKAINALYEDRQHRIWASVEGVGVVRSAGDHWTVLGSEDGVPSAAVNAFLETRQGDLWLATQTLGAIKLGKGAPTGLTRKDGLGDDGVNALLEDREGAVWLGTQGGLSRYKDGQMTTFHVAEGLGSNVVRCLAEDKDGNLWIGTEGGGLSRRTGDQLTTLRAKGGGLSFDSVWSVFEDKEGTLWMGSQGGGVDSFQDGKVIPLGPPEGLSDDIVFPILEDSRQRMWIGTTNGLDFVENGKVQRFTGGETLPSNAVSSLYEDHEKRLWIGTRLGLAVISDGQLHRLPPGSGPDDKYIAVIHQGKDGTLWVGTDGAGIYRRNGDRWTHFDTSSGFKSLVVRAIVDQPDGSILFGTATGLVSFREGKFSAPAGTEAFQEHVFFIYRDPRAKGTQWIGTWGGGLFRLRDGHLSQLNTKNGFYNDVVYNIFDAGDGNFWMTCNQGIFRMKVDDLDAIADGKAVKSAVTVLDKSAGMRAPECTGGLQPPGQTAHDGRFWVPTVSGVVILDPSLAGSRNPSPPVVLDQLVVDSVNIPASNPMRIPSGSKKLDFSYSAVTFRSPELTHYRYRLEGFDADWVEAGGRRSASYTNLAPGQYTFEVAAASGDGPWSSPAMTLSFQRPPRFRETGWFYLLVGSAVAAVAAGVYFLRIRQLQKQATLDIERKGLEKDLEVIGAVQSLILPLEARYADDQLQVCGYYRPTAACGGDWWWYEQASEAGRFQLFVGDVTGHGPGAAMITAMIAGALQTLRRENKSDPQALPRQLALVNQSLRSISRDSYGMTLAALEFDPDTGKLALWSAGAPPVLVTRTNGRLEVLIGKGAPMGNDAFDLKYTTSMLGRGDRAFVFTDGLTELRLPSGKDLGLKRLGQIMSGTAALELGAAVAKIGADLDAARADVALNDDLCFALLERRA